MAVDGQLTLERMPQDVADCAKRWLGVLAEGTEVKYLFCQNRRRSRSTLWSSHPERVKVKARWLRVGLTKTPNCLATACLTGICSGANI